MACTLERFWKRYLQYETGVLPGDSTVRNLLADFGESALALHAHCDPGMLLDTAEAISVLRENRRAFDGTADFLAQAAFPPPAEADLG